ncbi:MAG: hypothetical protein JWP49_1166 [Phenylobacterium sp.]|nr:hypothetical protein [Phenylobacterium sp.]
MAEHVQAGFGAYGPGDEDPVEVAPRPSLGMVLAGIVALAASGGLAWWFAGAGRPSDVSAAPPPAPPPRAEPAQPIRYAAVDPDPGEVRRAWSDVQRTYGDGGPEALIRASQACARGVPGDPQLLDYCLAYDIYASAVAPGGQGDWFAGSGDRGLALARMALPESLDAHNRIAQVAALTRAVLPAPTRPKTQQAHAVRRASPKAHAVKARHVRKPVAAKPKLVRASLHRPPAPVVRQPAPPPAFEAVRRQTLDDYLNRTQVEELVDPPH